MKICFEVEYKLGDTVYLKTDINQSPRMVIAYLYDACEKAMYRLVCGVTETNHHGIEISEEKDVLTSTTNY